MKTTTRRISRFRNALQKQVAYCATCQPYEDGGCVWILGVETDLPDLLAQIGVPSDDWLEVVDGVRCPNCGNSIDLGDVVGTKEQEERDRERFDSHWAKHLRPKLDSFQAHMEKWPYLGLGHPVGKRIARDMSSFPTISIATETWFRARSPAGGEPLQSKQLFPPDPLQIPIREGRYNHFGQRVFYLAETAEASVLETLEGSAGVAWTQEFELSNISKILLLDVDPRYEPGVELLAFGLLYGDHLVHEVHTREGWRPEYFVPRFIADCARSNEYNGIKFHSQRTLRANLVLFTWSEDTVRPIDDPRMLEVRRKSEF